MSKTVVVGNEFQISGRGVRQGPQPLWAASHQKKDHFEQQVKTFCFEIQKIFVDWYMDEGSLNGLYGFAKIELRIANWNWDKN